jgi:uncharacterized membrane protein (UPF0127 family)
MSGPADRSSAFNATRQTNLADDLRIADTHWTRLRGLLGASAAQFAQGQGLWIVPCRGVHTLGMSFPIDAIYLSADSKVVHLERNLLPWRFAPVRLNAKTVLEVPATTIEATGTALGDCIQIHRGGNSSNPGSFKTGSFKK